VTATKRHRANKSVERALMIVPCPDFVLIWWVQPPFTPHFAERTVTADFGALCRRIYVYADVVWWAHYTISQR
jgi:hypothetical protein